MAVYCSACAKARDLPRSAVRVALEPCDFCGGFEEQTVHKRVGRPGNRKLVETKEKMRNFDYPDKLINSMPGSFEKQAHREYEGHEVGE